MGALKFDWSLQELDSQHALDTPCSPEMELDYVPTHQHNAKPQLAEFHAIRLPKDGKIYSCANRELYLHDVLVLFRN